MLQCHLSGGEPLLRRDLVEIVAAANELGLYTNLVTSALGLSRPRAEQLRAAGLDHVQVSIQADEPAVSDRIAGTPSFQRKIEAMGVVKELGWPLTVNVVLHRQNIDRVADVLALAEEVGADRVELANTQYYGWAWRNRDALLPSRAQLEAAEVVVRAARERLRDRMDVIYVIPDYYSRYPKPCMGGWASRQLTVTPERRRAALPGRPVPAVAAGQRARGPAGADLGRVPGDDRVPRDGLDAGSLPQLRPPRAGLRRLPLPGVPAHRRRRPHRPGLPPVAGPRARGRRGAGRQRRGTADRPAARPPPAPGLTRGCCRRPKEAPSVMTSILIFVAGAALLVYSAEKLIVYLVGAASGLHVSVFLLAIIFTGIEFDDVAFGVVLNMEDLGEVALGTVFGTAIAMTGIVLALAAIITPTRVNIPRSYIALFAVSPLLMIPFILLGPLTAVHGVVLVLLFVAFIGYVATKELRSTTPVFRNAEILEKIEVGGGGAAPVAGTDRPTDKPPFTVTVPFNKSRPLPGWAGIALAVVALVGLVAGAAIMSYGTEGILEEYEIGATLFGATIATLVLTIEDIVLTVEPTRKGAPEIGVGNVIGSVVFGVTAKLGIILLAGGSILVDDDVLSWHLPVLVVMTGLSAYFIHTGRLRRWHGFVLLALYVAYWVISFTVLGEAPVEAD